MSQPVQYQCGAVAGTYLIDIDFDQILVVHNPPSLTMSVLGPGNAPSSMSGTTYPPDPAFTVQQVVLLGTPLACDESYTIVGDWQDENTFVGTFTADYQGVTCLDCTSHSQSFTATR